MNQFPDLESYGYQILEPIGQQDRGGRITWKAQDLNSNQIVLVNEFCFATANSTWSGYKAYQQEIAILQNLNHPFIPQYIDSFETQDGFCWIQKYIQAQNLNPKNSFTTSQIKRIAKKLLEILVYLQQQNPPIIHRNINPENILIDELENVYLVNFELATRLNIIDNNDTISILGTPGFIAPEQEPTPSKSFDLYSLGMTIICLLTNKKTSEVGELIAPDNPYEIQFQYFTSELDIEFLEWLKKMLNPQVNKGYADAKSALKALKEIDWDLEEKSLTLQQQSLPKNVSLSAKKYIFSTVGMGILGTTITIGFKVANRVTDTTIVNITIALIGMIVIYLAQYGAATSFKTDLQGKTEAWLLAIATPATLTIAAGFIFGRGEALAISVAAIMAQTAVLTVTLWQKLAPKNLLKIMGLLGAILSGIVLGLTFQ